MSDRTKSILQVLIIVCLVALLFVWVLIDPRDGLFLAWGPRTGLPLLAAVLCVPLIRSALAKDQIPHVLERLTLEHFAKDGVIFAVQLRVVGDLLQVAVIGQNCFERRCEATVHLDPPQRHRSFRLKPDPEMMLTVPLHIEGGAAAMAVVYVGVPKRFQGGTQAFELRVRQRYPGGRGRRLLRARGMLLIDQSIASTNSTVSTMIHATRSVSGVKYPPAVELPEGMRETSDGLPEATLATLWKPADGDPDVGIIRERIEAALVGRGVPA